MRTAPTFSSFTQPAHAGTSEESQMLNHGSPPPMSTSPLPHVDAVRIRHHLNTSLAAGGAPGVRGLPGEGTLGRARLACVKSVRLFGEEFAVHARIVNFRVSFPRGPNHCSPGSRPSGPPTPARVRGHGYRGWRPFFARHPRAWGFNRPTRQYNGCVTRPDRRQGARAPRGYLPDGRPGPTGGNRASAA